MTGIIQRVTGCIDRMPVIGNQSLLSGWMGAGKTNQHFGKDWVSWLNRTPKKGGVFHSLLNICLPGPLRPALGKVVHTFCNFPLMKRISNWGQLMVGCDALMGVFSAFKEGVSGYRKASGTILSKASAGIKSALSSFARSALFIGAYVTGSFALPAVLGLSVLNMSGILAGILGANIFKRFAEKLIAKPLTPKPALNPFQFTPESPIMGQKVSEDGHNDGSIPLYVRAGES